MVEYKYGVKNNFSHFKVAVTLLNSFSFCLPLASSDEFTQASVIK